MAGSDKRRMGIVALIMAAIVLAAVLITVFTGAWGKDDNRLNIVASFYPIYSAAVRLTEGAQGVGVINLTPAQTGCLHDYQLSPDDVISLNNADALVINGAGAESFLGDISSQYPQLTVFDTSTGTQLIEGEHDHHHEEDDYQHDEYELNEHIWTSPSNYIKQVENLRDGLIKIDPEYAEKYRANSDEYIKEIQDIRNELLSAAEGLPTKNCIIFDGSLAYIAKELGLNPIAELSIGEGSVLSAAGLSKAALAAKSADKVLLIFDDQYDTEYTNIADGVSYSRVLRFDTAVTDKGSNARDAWINAQRSNLQKLKEISR